MNHQDQLTLRLSLKDEANFASFYPGKNLAVINELKKAASGIGEQVIYLCNVGSFGASHLLQAACHEAHQHDRTSVYLPMHQLVHLSPDILSNLERLSLVCLDDIHLLAGKKEWEENFFHLYNRLLDAKKTLILSANNLPKAICFDLADLTSRLSFGVLFQLHPLADDEKQNALALRAKARGIYLSDDVAKYILTHCSRHMGTLFAALDALDKASLTAQKRLTIPFVKTVLQI